MKDRIIKFRAWDKTEKRMVSAEELRNLKCSLDVVTGEIVCLTNTSYYTDPDPEDISFSLLPRDKYEVMQYTGVTDVDGNEIYEGDIVEWKAGYYKALRNQTVRDVVAFLGGYFGCEDTQGGLLSIRPFKKIGNIYENPDYSPPTIQRGRQGGKESKKI